MSENIEKKVVSGIAIRRKSGGREKQILLVEEEGKWEFPKVRVKYEAEGLEELATYMSETLDIGKIGINNFYVNGWNRGRTKKTMEAYLVTVFSGKKDSMNGKSYVGWFSKAEIEDKFVSNITSSIIKSLKRDRYF